MALFTNTYSGLITKGLGMPSACCGLLTMGFGVFKCTITVTPPLVGGGGGGPYPPSMIHNPARGTPTKGFINYHTPRDPRTVSNRFIHITLKMGDKTFEKIFSTDDNNAEKVVKVVSVINKAKDRISIVINSIKSMYDKNNDDK